VKVKIEDVVRVVAEKVERERAGGWRERGRDPARERRDRRRGRT